MNKQLRLSVIIAATTLTGAFSVPATQAFEAYSDGSTKASIYGSMRPAYVQSDGDDQMTNGTSRLGLTFQRDLTDGWQVLARSEWALKLVNSNQDLEVDVSANDNDNTIGSSGEIDSFSTRLGYVGITHDTYGSITAGKQWGSHSVVAEITDQFEIYGGQAGGMYNFGTDGGYTGTGRADQALQYNNSFGNFAISAQIQLVEGDIDTTDGSSNITKATYDNTYGASAMYHSDMGFSIGASYNKATAELEYCSTCIGPDEIDDKIWAAGIKIGTIDKPGFYGAVLYTESENHEIDDKGELFDAEGTEIYLSYRTENNWNIHGGYNHLEADDSDYGDTSMEQYELEYYVIGAVYYWTDFFRMVAEYKSEESTNANGKSADDVIGLGVRLDF